MIIVYILLFLGFLSFLAYPVGWLITKKSQLELTSWERIFLSILFGLLFTTVEGYLIGSIGLLQVMPFLMLGQNFLVLLYYRAELIKNPIKSISINKYPLLLIILSLFINSLITFTQGVPNNQGILLGGAHSVDNTWHLALIHSLQKSIPPENPLYAGEILKNYHYFVDLQISIIQNVTKIPLPELYFQIIGPFYIQLFLAIAYLLGRRLAGAWGGVILVLFSGLSSNWYYLAGFFYPEAMLWPSVAWIDFFSSKSVNYPLLLSFVILYALIFIYIQLKKFTLWQMIIFGSLLGVLMPIKSHTAFVLISSFGVLSLWHLLARRDLRLLSSTIIGGVVSVIFLISNLEIGKGGLIFHPFWFIRVMYEASDRLNYPTWELKRQYLLSVNGFKGIIRLYAQGLSDFILINFVGVLMIFLLFVKKLLTRFTDLKLLCYLIILSSFFFTMAFIYSGIAIITIQFFYPALAASWILLITLLNGLSAKPKKIFLVLVTLIWLSSLPGVVYTLKTYLPSNSDASIDLETPIALAYLLEQPDGIVLVHPGFFGSSLVSAYSGKTSYFANEIVVSTVGIDPNPRKQQVEEFFNCDSKFNDLLLQENNIRYIFTTPGDCLEDRLKKLFSNSAVAIYQY